MSDEDSQGFRHEQDELSSMPEYQTILQVRHFQQSLYAFQKNYFGLKSVMDHYVASPEGIKLMNVSRRHKLDDYFFELLRHVQNFVSSASSLIDHARVLFGKVYKPADRFPDYQGEIDKRFKDDPLSQFVVGFRQFCLHYRPPNIAAEMNFVAGVSFTRSVVILRSELIEFSGWNKPAKTFLEQEGEKLNLSLVFERYFKHVTDFYGWFYSRLEQIHADDVATIERKQAELRQKMAPQILSLIKTSLSLVERGIMAPCDLLAGVLSSDDHVQLAHLEGTPRKWMEEAIELARGKIDIPDALVKRLLEVCR